MSCNIINPATVSLNGGSSAYGGNISNVSLNFGLLSQGTNATVTLVGASMTNPAKGDSFTLGIMDLDLNMKVAGYTFSSSATGATTLRLTLKDRSNETLDNNFIVRKEEVPDGLEGPIKYLGTKYGTLPNDIAMDYGILIPSSDTMWGDLRKYFTEIQILYNVFYKSWSANFMLDEDVDAHVKAANGKTIWTTDELKEILEDADILDGSADFPSGSFQLDGSYREVIMGVANTLGWVVYWDCTDNELVFEKAVSSSAGNLVLDDLADKCEVVASSTSSDFTTSLSVGAIGSFSTNSSDTQQQKSQGGKMAKFYRGTALTPTFHYPQCYETEKMFELDVGEDDVQKAFYASWHPEFYAMYVLQTVLRAKSDRGDEAEDVLTFAADVANKGRDNEKPDNFRAAIKDNIETDPCIKWSINSVFENYYVDVDDANNTEDCCDNVHAIFFSDADGKPSEPNVALAKEAGQNNKDNGGGWNNKPQQLPFKVGSYWKDFEFEEGYHIIRDITKDKEADGWNFDKILNNDGLDGSRDNLRLYLNAVFRFYNRFHVIKVGGTLRNISGKGDKFYNYYITQDAQGPGLSITAPNGFEHRSVDPYLSVEECGIAELIDLFKACELLYNGTCEEIGNTAIIDWIKVLDSNKIKEFFDNPGIQQKARKGPFTQEELDATCSSQPQMHLFIQPGQEDPFESTAATDCYGGSTSQQANGIWDQIGGFDLSGGTTAYFEKFEKRYQSFVVTHTNIDTEASKNKMSPAGRARSKVKAWIDIEGSMGTLTTGPGPQYIGAAAMPDGGTWTSKLNRGISIDAADIAQKAGDTMSDYGGGNCYQGTPENEAKAYSDFMIGAMRPELEEKVKAHKWTDKTSASSRTITLVLGDDFGDITLPTISEGLEALSMTNSNGKLEISITVGNRFERESKRAMFELMGSVPSLQHVAAPNIPDTFIGGASPKLVQISKGMI